MSPPRRSPEEWPTARQPVSSPPPTTPSGRFGWPALLGAGLVGLLCGVALVTVIALAAGGPARTVTLPASAAPATGAPVVPNVVGIRYDRAKAAVHRAGYSDLREGGGLLGVIDDSNWKVVAESPPAGGAAASRRRRATVDRARLSAKGRVGARW